MADTMTPAPNNTLYITQVTLPTGNTYELIDENARKTITDINTTVNTMSKYTSFLGVVSSDTNISDGSTNAIVNIDGTNITATTGNIVIKTVSTTAGRMAQEFIWIGSKWQLFGDISAENLGNLAYKNSATSTANFIKTITIDDTQTTAVSVTTSYQPQGNIELTQSSINISLATTSTTPTSTTNYWVYNPAENISITAAKPGITSSSVINSVIGRNLISSLTHAVPNNNAPTNGFGTYVNANNESHTLNFNYIVSSKENSISATTTIDAVTTVSAPSVTYSGTTRYIKYITVTNTTAATFTGTTKTITSSGVQKIASITSTSDIVTVS